MEVVTEIDFMRKIIFGNFPEKLGLCESKKKHPAERLFAGWAV